MFNFLHRFRWVVCQLDVLRKCLTVDGLRTTLKTLPKSLDETYDRILSNIDEEHSSHARNILQWLAFSVRPVTLEEVAAGLAVDLDHSCLLDPDQQLQDPYDILTICSSLVTMSDESQPHQHSDEESGEKDKSMLFSTMRLLTMHADGFNGYSSS
jgi:hypothetical protein